MAHASPAHVTKSAMLWMVWNRCLQLWQFEASAGAPLYFSSGNLFSGYSCHICACSHAHTRPCVCRGPAMWSVKQTGLDTGFCLGLNTLCFYFCLLFYSVMPSRHAYYAFEFNLLFSNYAQIFFVHRKHLSAATEGGWTSKMSIKALAQVSIWFGEFSNVLTWIEASLLFSLV